ncbi:MAG: hypothetical protein H8E63_06320 [Proteobacteria bacterium]|nr:hypothetical protein [Pseudomonadota bacterium]
MTSEKASSITTAEKSAVNAMAQFRLENGLVYGSVSCTSLGDGFFRFDIQVF